MKRSIFICLLSLAWLLCSGWTYGQEDYMKHPENNRTGEEVYALDGQSTLDLPSKGLNALAAIQNPIGNTRNNPILAGSYSANFQYTSTKNTADGYTNNFGWGNNGIDIFYEVTVRTPMTLSISLCNSQIQDTYLYLVDIRDPYALAGYNDNSDYCGSGSKHAYLSVVVPEGTYWVICEDKYTPGPITVNITGTIVSTPPPATIGDSRAKPIDLGTFSTGFTRSDTKNTASGFTNQYGGRPTNDVFYKFTITTPMEVSIALCESELVDTYLYLLDGNGAMLYFNDDDNVYPTHCNSLRSYISRPLLQGTYYVVAKGFSLNGNITTRIEGQPQFVAPPPGDTRQDAIDLGTYSSAFTRSDTRNTNDYSTQFGGSRAGDVFYRFTITREMEVTISHCGSGINYTLLYLQNAFGATIGGSHTNATYCPGTYQTQMEKVILPAGTYYVISKGNEYNGNEVNGNITTRVTGGIYVPAPPPGDTRQDAIDLGTYNTAFSRTETRNTASGFTNQYTGRPTSDVFYKFTTTRVMDVVVSLCASALSDTYLYLLNASGTLVASNDNSNQCGAGSLKSYLSMPSLAAGTYYVVCEGNTANGSITTQVGGTLIREPEIPVDPELPQVPDVPVAASSSRNYIHTYSATSAVSAASGFTTSNSLQTIRYFDGLGRPIETVQAALSPGKKDLVSFQTYDGFGRESEAWLPGEISSGGNGSFRTPDASLTAAIKGSYGNGDNSGDNNPYSRPVYEPSPLNRVEQAFGPGQNWHNNGKSVKTEYRSNRQDEAIYFFLSGDDVKSNGYYYPNSLYVTQVTDEDGNRSLEFKDKLGRVVMEKHEEETCTYYIYDDLGNLCCVLPPMAVEGYSPGTTLAPSNSRIADFAYLYRYDHRNRCREKKLPGAGWISMVYDKADRLALSQDAVQKSAGGKWTFLLYDNLGRTVMEGEVALSAPLSDLQQWYLANSATAAYTGSGVHRYGTAKVMDTPLSEANVYRVNYYDRGDWTADASLQVASAAGYPVPYSQLQGRLSGNISKILGAAAGAVTTSCHYDFKGNLVQSHSVDHQGVRDHLYSSYSFDNRVEKSLSEHAGLNGQQVREEYEYLYDHAGRLVKKRYGLNGESLRALAVYSYDKLGRQSSRILMGADTTSFTYNIRGWLRDLKGRHFEQSIYYDQLYRPWETGFYNGNIHSVRSRTSGKPFQGFLYTYDRLNRLKSLDQREWDSWSQMHYVDYTYDKNGNMTKLNRYTDAVAKYFWTFDELTFTPEGNRIKSIQENAPNLNSPTLMDYRKTPQNTYSYDANGRLQANSNKNISSVGYNWLHLPQRIQFGDNKRIEYLYDASGVKREVKHTPVAGAAVSRQYIGNKVYDDGALKMILTEDGFIKKDGSRYDRYYYLKDYLGNNRVVVDAKGAVAQTTDYYPFGVSEAGSTESEQQPYKFGGKELDRMCDLDMYDFGARMYDPVVGRFTTMDPLVEKYYNISPYAYCKNNPVKYVDPTGMLVDDYYYNEAGQQIYRASNNNPDRNFVIKTTQTTDAMYGTANSSQKGKSQPIKVEAATTTESEISAGNLTGDHMKNVVQIQSTDKMNAMINSIKDNGKGGTSATNNKEYSGSFGGKNGVYNTQESTSGKPSEGKPLVTTGNGDYHSHPSGTEKFTINGKSYTGSWQQPPSKQDISVAGSKNQYVAAMGNGIIYIYNNKGVIATIPINTFK